MLPNKDVIAEIGKFKSGINKGNFKNCKNKNFDPRDNDLFKNAVHLAYLDAARTFSKINSSSGTAEAELAKAIQNYFKGQACAKKEDFDTLHFNLCNDFIKNLSSIGYTSVTYGQAQKIVNMTFKYLYCLNGATSPQYNDYFDFCHVALDSFTLEWIWRNCNPKASKLNKYEAWSNLDKVDYYAGKTKRPGYDSIVALYRKKIPSSLHTDCTPFQAEFIFWPKIQMHLATEAFYFALNGNMSNKQKETFKAKDLKSKKAEIINHPNF